MRHAGGMSPTAERARDLLDALEVLVRQRNAEPEAYRAVHAAATRLIGELHADLLDPRVGGDFEAAVARHAELARRLRAMPRPSGGQPARGGGSEPLAALLGQSRRGGTSVEGLLGEVAAGVVPQLERAVREGLRDLLGVTGWPDGPEVDPGDGPGSARK